MKITSFLLNAAAGASCLASASFAAPNYVAHEWGTFTSVQGADGVQIAWNGLSVSDLPGFVYDWSKTGPPARKAAFTKLGSAALQRMETPVIYFYAEEELAVNALVKFPQGLMTEWYPKAITPVAKGDGTGAAKALRWDNIRIFPSASSRDGKPGIPGAPRSDNTGSHYFAARETDADLIQVNGETEKFLFYRGLGNFQAPLAVTQSGDNAERVTLKNNGADELRHLFVYQSNGGGARFTYVPRLAADESREVELEGKLSMESPSTVQTALASGLEKALVREGLYEREARAMVNTWRDSWLGERGVRILYTLPQRWTDAALPLTLDPKPAEIARVMVGRAELITPRMEWDVMREIVRYSTGAESEKSKAVAEIRALELGRFLDAAVRRLTARIPSQALAEHAYGLLADVNKSRSKGKELAVK